MRARQIDFWKCIHIEFYISSHFCIYDNFKRMHVNEW